MWCMQIFLYFLNHLSFSRFLSMMLTLCFLFIFMRLSLCLFLSHIDTRIADFICSALILFSLSLFNTFILWVSLHNHYTSIRLFQHFYQMVFLLLVGIMLQSKRQISSRAITFACVLDLIVWEYACHTHILSFQNKISIRFLFMSSTFF